jgi:hypothetical protein
MSTTDTSTDLAALTGDFSFDNPTKTGACERARTTQPPPAESSLASRSWARRNQRWPPGTSSSR